jgi:hypothetical protein
VRYRGEMGAGTKPPKDDFALTKFCFEPEVPNVAARAA